MFVYKYVLSLYFRSKISESEPQVDIYTVPPA